MRIPLSWIKEYLPLSHSVEEIASLLTMAGLEVDSYQTFGNRFKNIVVGKVLEVEKHPQADKLVVAKVTDGNETYQVVCGAPNCRAGLITAFAPIGASLDDSQGTFVIKKSRLRNVDSFGMLCSGKELGLTDDDDGIMELSGQLPLGSLLSNWFSDTIFEISLTPNLGHCASILGVVRELSAATNQRYLVPIPKLNEGTHSIFDQIEVEVKNPQQCPRYACRLIQNINVAPSPDWLKERIEKSGLRSINNIVDITNYVLLEFGHPLHAFDLDKINGRHLIVRLAEEGETIVTLDGKERALLPSHLVIADQDRSLAIAGVMGGLYSEVSDVTHSILLEAAYFDPVTIRKASKQLGLQTEASKHFERGADANQIELALNRAAQLIQEVAGGEILEGILDIQTQTFEPKSIQCRSSRTNKILGIHISQGEIEDIFKRLGFETLYISEEQLMVTVPTYRVDIREEIDLIEEVARIYGYGNIKGKRSGARPSIIPDAPMYIFESQMRALLIQEGMQEFLTCDLIGPTLTQIVQDQTISPDSTINVINPVSIEQSILRTSLLPGLLQVVKYNYDHQCHAIKGFEIGRIHFKNGSQFVEQSMVGMILTGPSHPHNWNTISQLFDFFDLKGIIEVFCKELGIQQLVFKNLNLSSLHTGRQASVFVGDLEIGSFGEIHPAVQRRLDVPQRILFAEFNLHDLLKVSKPLERVSELPLYPGSERDITLTIEQRVSFQNVLDAIQIKKFPLLENVSLVGIYRNDKIGREFQNMTLRLNYRDLNKTLSKEEVEAEHQRVLADLHSHLKGDIVA